MKRAVKPPPDRPVLQAEALPGESAQRARARALLRPSVQAALTLRSVNHGVTDDDADLMSLVNELTNQVQTATGGDLGRAEAMLVTQAHTLDALFHRLVRQALPNIGHYPQTVELYMKLALRAQSQARATIEALNELKNPRQVLIAQQANIASGPQQVNNERVPQPVRAGAGAIDNQQQELLRPTVPQQTTEVSR